MTAHVNIANKLANTPAKGSESVVWRKFFDRTEKWGKFSVYCEWIKCFVVVALFRLGAAGATRVSNRGTTGCLWASKKLCRPPFSLVSRLSLDGAFCTVRQMRARTGIGSGWSTDKVPGNSEVQLDSHVLIGQGGGD